MKTIQPYRLSSSALRCLVAIVFLSLPLFELSCRSSQIEMIYQSYGQSDSIVSRQTDTYTTQILYGDDSSRIAFGLRLRDPIYDIALKTTVALDKSHRWTQTSLISHLHYAYGIADSSHVNGVLGYNRLIHFERKRNVLQLSYGLGLQGSLVYMPFIDDPLFHLAPYLCAELSLHAFDRISVSTQIATNTMFTFSCQSLSPIASGTIAFAVTDAFTLGAGVDIQFSDIYPESVLVSSRETKVYVIWTRNEV